MRRIGLLSDTHGYWDPRYESHFGECDEIWHAGDIGTEEVAERLAAVAPLRAVHGNIDGAMLRHLYPKVERWKCEDVDVMMTHIGGYPGHYEPGVRRIIYASPPQLFISGHSHILKVVNDPSLALLHINPGAAGLSGFHQVRTLVRFTIDGADIRDLEVVELGRRG